MEKSALVVPVVLPPALDDLRRRFDPIATVLPPHLSIVVPFAERGIDASQRLRDIAARFYKFSIPVECVGEFVGDPLDTIYLGLRINRDLGLLLAAVQSAFPQYLPYAGKHDPVICHVTVARVVPEQTQKVGAMAVSALGASVGTWSFDVNALAWIYGSPTNWGTDTYFFQGQ